MNTQQIPPVPPAIPQATNDNGRPATVKILFIGILAAVLIIPMLFVHVLISEREDTMREASREVGRAWSGAQLVAGPSLTIPYLYLNEDKVNEIATLAGLAPNDLITQTAGQTFTSTKNGTNPAQIGNAKLEVVNTTTKADAFKLTIPAGAVIDAKGETIVFNPTITYDDQTTFKLNVTISVPPTAGFPSQVMTLGPQWQNGEVLLVPSYTYTEKTETKDDVTTTWREVTGVSWNVPFTSLFNNFNTNIGTITGKGGNFTLSAINKSQNLAGLDIKKGGTTATAGSQFVDETLFRLDEDYQSVFKFYQYYNPQTFTNERVNLYCDRPFSAFVCTYENMTGEGLDDWAEEHLTGAANTLYNYYYLTPSVTCYIPAVSVMA